jgi:UDPglucose 6-dehydrogenase
VLAERGRDIPFSVVSNPEFLKEGAAIQDFMRPDRIIVGSDDHRATVQLRNLYAPFNRNRDRLIEMDVRSAELTKYAANAMLATKISFMNEMANLAERLGADIEKVRVGIGADPRIGYHFIYPGCGYGGSCFPKDVKALEYTARSANYEAVLLQAVEAVNERQKNVLFAKLQRHFGDGLRGRTFALWGLAFKPGTDDMREAPSRNLLEALWREGCMVRAHDPAAMNEARRLYGERPDFQLFERPMDVLPGADALVIITEWSLFRSPDFDAIRQQLQQPLIFDGRNLYEPEYVRELGFVYYAIGRGEIS